MNEREERTSDETDILTAGTNAVTQSTSPATPGELRDLSRKRSALILMAGAASVLLAVSLVVQRKSIETELKSRVEGVLRQANQPGIVVSVTAREVTLEGVVGSEDQRAEAIRLAKKRYGVRSVNGEALQIDPAALLASATSTVVPVASDTAPVVGNPSAVSSTNLVAETSLSTTLRPTVVDARVAGSVLTVRATVSDKAIEDLLLTRAGEGLSADQIVNEVVVDRNDGRSNEEAHRRIGRFIEYLVKSRVDSAQMKFNDGDVVLEAIVKTAAEGAQLRAEAVTLAGDESKIRANITVNEEAVPSTEPVLGSTTTIAVDPVRLAADVATGQEKVIAALGGRTISFAKEADVLDENGKAVVDAVAAALKGTNPSLQVRVEGFTDSRGSAGGNRRLSERRTTSVRDRLVSAGIEAGRIVTAGRGEESPIGDNRTEEGRAINRRIEIDVFAPVPAAP